MLGRPLLWINQVLWSHPRFYVSTVDTHRWYLTHGLLINCLDTQYLWVIISSSSYCLTCHPCEPCTDKVGKHTNTQTHKYTNTLANTQIQIPTGEKRRSREVGKKAWHVQESSWFWVHTMTQIKIDWYRTPLYVTSEVSSLLLTASDTSDKSDPKITIVSWPHCGLEKTTEHCNNCSPAPWSNRTLLMSR